MQENLVWAASYNVFAILFGAGVPVSIGIVLSPAVGALLISRSTVIVAINAQFLHCVDLTVSSLPRSGTILPETSPTPAE